MNLHPGIIPVLRKMGANELDIARMIASGDLVSPQKFHNVSLFKIRITGTGISYRPAHDEYVYRRPEDYLTEDFLQRCNGLPVIMNHPEKSLLNSDEFADRVVGTVLLPYIEGEEVWAVSKIYDDEAIKILDSRQMSTSPAVLLNKSSKQTINGTEVLVEGSPTLLDHIALCENGVWDKGGDPTGVQHIDHQVRKDSAMTEEQKEKEKADAAARADAEKAKADSDAKADAKFKMLMDALTGASAKLDSLSSRMDAFEKGDKEEEEDKDKEKKDSEEEDKEKDKDKMKEETEAKEKAADAARKDAARADSARTAALEAQIKAQNEKLAELEARFRPLPESSRAELTEAQSRADSVMMAFGDEAPRPLSGETSINYRRRISSMLQKHSPNWKDIPLEGLSEKAFDVAEKQIYADAAMAARRPVDIQKGKMREITRTTQTGHRVTEFYANEGTHFVHQFRRPLRKVGRFNIGQR